MSSEEKQHESRQFGCDSRMYAPHDAKSTRQAFEACSALGFPIYLQRPPKPGAQERRLRVTYVPGCLTNYHLSKRHASPRKSMLKAMRSYNLTAE